MNILKNLVLSTLFVVSLYGSSLFDGDGDITSVLTSDNLNEATSFANPGKVPVRLGVVRINSKGHHYGWETTTTNKSDNAEFVVSFNNPTTVGSLFVVGDFKTSYLLGTNNWQQFRYPGEDARLVQVIPMPKLEEISAFKLVAPFEWSQDGQLKKSVPLVVPLKGRYINIAPESEVKVSSTVQPKDGFRPDPRQSNSEILLDGSLEAGNWKSAKNEEVISEENREWILLDWHEQKNMRGCIIVMGTHDSGFGTCLVQQFVGKGIPNETVDSQWKTVATMNSYKKWRPPLCWEAVADFGKDINTRALRFVFTSGLTKEQSDRGEGADDKQISIGEIVVLQDLHDEPIPKRIIRRKSLPDGVVPITFKMPEAGKATIRIRNADGEVVKNLVNGESFDKGKNTIYWDLSNLEDYWYPFERSKHEYTPPTDSQKIALPGKYTWEGIWHPGLELEYKDSYYPLKKHGVAWKSADKTGGWLADHQPPKTIVRAADKMWVGTFAEAGDAILESDLDMKKLYGENRIWLACPKMLTYDNEKIYYLNQDGWAKKIVIIEIDAKTKVSRRLLAKDLDKDKKIDYVGFVVKGDKAYITDNYNDKLIVVDISSNLTARSQGFGWDRVYKIADHENMDVIKEVELAKPGRLRQYDDEHFIGISDKQVVLINYNDFKVTPIVSGLINPAGLAWDDAHKEIYVGEVDPLHQVKVFDINGKLLRTIGKEGKHKLSTKKVMFDNNNLESPVGIDVDANGNLWVCEANHELKRTSVWNRKGKCINNVLGPTVYGGGGDIDPHDANRMFYSGKEFHRDPLTGDIKLARINWRGSESLVFSGVRAHNFNGCSPSYPFYNNGKLFFSMFQGWAMGGINCLYAYEDGKIFPVAALGTTPAVIYAALGIDHVSDRKFGHAVLSRTDKMIDFNWHQGSPDDKVDNEKFSIRWSGDIIIPESGSYKFYVKSSSNARISIGDDMVLDQWSWNKKLWRSERDVNLVAGHYPIIVDLHDSRGASNIKLEWSSKQFEKQIVPSSFIRVSSDKNAEEGLKGIYFNKGRKDNVFTWTDINADGKIQKNEIKTKTYSGDEGLCNGAGGTWQFKINKNFQAAACTYGGGTRELLFFESIAKTDKGYPVYELPKELITYPGKEASALMVDEKGNAIILSQYVYSISPEGKINWRYINRWPSLHSGHRTSSTGEEPGVLVATTRFLGAAPINSDIGEAISISSNLGSSYLFTDQGFYIDRIFKDIRVGLAWKCNEAPDKDFMSKVSLGDEHFAGTFQKTKDADGIHYQYVVGQPHSSVVEITGLDDIKKLKGGKFKVTGEDLIAAEKLQLKRALKKAVKKEYIVKYSDSIDVDGKDTEWSKERIDGFALAYDKEYLYILFSGRDWRAPFKNATTENFTVAFKNGDVVDLMLQTKGDINPLRENAEHGDIRISLTQINGEPAVILYDYVVPGTSASRRMSFSSPWRTIFIDQVRTLPNAKIAVIRGKDNYILEAAIPLKDIHFDPKATPSVRGDVGRVISDQTGTRAVDRIYWSNKNTKIVADVPSEANVQPKLWGYFTFEENENARDEKSLMSQE
jgi:hypothetical protein